MGESPRARKNEVQAVMQAFEMGYRLIDTAEMYGDGGAESVVGEAIQLAINAGSVRREELIVVTKVLPSHATRYGVVRACERSLKRLAIDTVDLYLLHWRGATPLKETVAAFEQLRDQGRIQQWGVSNFDTSDMQQLWSFAEGRRCIAIRSTTPPAHAMQSLIYFHGIVNTASSRWRTHRSIKELWRATQRLTAWVGAMESAHRPRRWRGYCASPTCLQSRKQSARHTCVKTTLPQTST